MATHDPTPPCPECRVLTPQLFFNSSLWYQQRDIIVMATDDDIIRDSPYGAVLNMKSLSNRSEYNDRMINLSLVIQDTDDGECCIMHYSMDAF